MENTVRGRDQRTLNYSKIPCERVSRTYCLLASTAALFLSKLRYGRHSAVPFLSVLSVQHLLSCRTSSSLLLLLLSNLLRCWKSSFVRDQNKRRLHAAIIINAIPTLGKRQQRGTFQRTGEILGHAPFPTGNLRASLHVLPIELFPPLSTRSS